MDLFGLFSLWFLGVDSFGWVMVVFYFWVGNCELVIVGFFFIWPGVLCLGIFLVLRGRTQPSAFELAGEVHKLTCTSTSLPGHSTSLRGTYTGSRGNSQSSLIAPVLRALPAVTKVDG